MDMSNFYSFLNKYGLGHILEGALIYIPIFFIDSWIAFTAVFFFYLGRERRDHEIAAKIPTNDWYVGWNIFTWSKDGIMDLIPVTIFYLLTTLVINFFWM